MEYLGRIFKYLKNYKLQIAFILFVQLLYAFFSIFTLTLLVPFLQVLFHQVEAVTVRPEFSFSPQYLIDTFYYLMNSVIERHGQTSALLFIAGTMILLSFLANLCRYAGMFWLSHIRSGILSHIRDDFYRKLIRLPLSFYTKQRSGDIVSRMGADGHLFAIGIVPRPFPDHRLFDHIVYHQCETQRDNALDSAADGGCSLRYREEYPQLFTAVAGADRKHDRLFRRSRGWLARHQRV